MFTSAAERPQNVAPGVSPVRRSVTIASPSGAKELCSRTDFGAASSPPSPSSLPTFGWRSALALPYCFPLILSSRASATQHMREPALSEVEGERERRDLAFFPGCFELFLPFKIEPKASTRCGQNKK